MFCKCGRKISRITRTCDNGGCIEGRNGFFKIEKCVLTSCNYDRKSGCWTCSHHQVKYGYIWDYISQNEMQMR